MMVWGDAISLGQHHYQLTSHRFPSPVLALCSTLEEGNLGKVRRRRSAISNRVVAQGGAPGAAGPPTGFRGDAWLPGRQPQAAATGGPGLSAAFVSEGALYQPLSPQEQSMLMKQCSGFAALPKLAEMTGNLSMTERNRDWK